MEKSLWHHFVAYSGPFTVKTCDGSHRGLSPGDSAHSGPGVGKLFLERIGEYPSRMVSVTATQTGSCGVNTARATREPPAWLGSSGFVYKNNWHLAGGCSLPTPAGKFCKSRVNAKQKKRYRLKGMWKKTRVSLRAVESQVQC